MMSILKSCAIPIFLVFSLTFWLGCGTGSSSDYSSAPGKLYDIGGYSLQLQTLGSGSPTVVFEAGSGDFSLTWALVAPIVAHTNRVCVYDRAGLGWSDPSPYPRLATIEVAELHALLAKAQIPPPYIMVGHSMGGVLARLFTHTYSIEVVGLVLVDPGHEEQKTAQDLDVQQSMNQAVAASIIKLSDAASKCASATLSETEINAFINPLLPDKEKGEYAYVFRNRVNYWRSVVAETIFLDESFVGVKNENISSLGSVPLVVLRSSATLELATTPELSVKADRVLRSLQRQIAAQSTNGQFTTVEGTTHYIQLIKPQAVINAINQVQGLNQ